MGLGRRAKLSAICFYHHLRYIRGEERVLRSMAINRSRRQWLRERQAEGQPYTITRGSGVWVGDMIGVIRLPHLATSGRKVAWYDRATQGLERSLAKTLQLFVSSRSRGEGKCRDLGNRDAGNWDAGSW